nr:TerB family tellurite resistance protein [Zoogloeaceae bacterium]
MTFAPTPEQVEVAADLIAFMLISDGILSTREIDALEQYRIPEQLGLSHDDLLRAIVRHCRQLLDRQPNAESLRVVDVEQFERRLDRITDSCLQVLIARALLVLAKSDGQITQPEQTLIRDMLTRWDLPLESVRA